VRVRVAERNADTRRDRYRRAIETTEHGNDDLLQQEKMSAAQSALELWRVFVVFNGGSSL
jgi:hypothetical protein